MCIELSPALLIPGYTEIGKPRILDAENIDLIICVTALLTAPEFNTENRFYIVLLTGLYKLVCTGSIVDVLQNKGLNTPLHRRFHQALGRQCPIFQRIICVAVQMHVKRQNREYVDFIV